MLAHAEGHVGIGLGRLAFLEFVGQFVPLGGLDFIDITVKDVQIRHPNVVGVPSDFEFGHPKWTDLNFVHRAFVALAACLRRVGSHREASAGNRQHLDFRWRVFDAFDVRHLLLG